ncbi:MAG TPA: branched-chain amino acid ABC transporter permease [Tepidisphaeraceae bacterium]|jgi:branched-chain amino acid transport system permease protein|nr:branched-chain amino acid ABC transporter permease [Tepidisphaeraceae bacterium]
MSQTSPAILPSLPHPRIPAWVFNLSILLLIAALYPVKSLLESNLDPYFYQVLMLIGLHIILAVSLNLINGITGQFSLGHAGFLAVGAYTAGILLKHYHLPTGLTGSLLYLTTILLAGLVTAFSGLLIGIPCLRLRGDYLAIATLGFGEIINIVIVNTDSIGPFDVGGSSGLHAIPILANFFWVFAAVVICVVSVWRIAYSSKGKAFAAIRDDEIAAAAMGVNTTYYKVAAFAIGAFFAGVAGALWATWFGDLDPSSFGFMKSFDIVVMVVLGGSGSITGSILAATILTILPEWLRFLSQYRLVIYSLMLIFMMLFRPQGLLGNREFFRFKKPRVASSK